MDYADILPYIHLEDGLVPLLEMLRRFRVRRAVHTNRTTTIERLLQHFGIDRFFFPIVGAGSLAYPKPNPEGVYRILGAWGLPKETVAYIGDSALDERTARAAGIQFWSFKNPGLLAAMHGTFAANLAISNADCILAIGSRFDDRVTGKISEFAKKAKIVHIDIDPTSIQKNVPVHIPVVADCKSFLTALRQALEPGLAANPPAQDAHHAGVAAFFCWIVPGADAGVDFSRFGRSRQGRHAALQRLFFRAKREDLRPSSQGYRLLHLVDQGGQRRADQGCAGPSGFAFGLLGVVPQCR